MFGLDAPALIVILIIILVVFAGSQLPKLAKSLGTSEKEIREALKDDPTDIDKKPAEKKPAAKKTAAKKTAKKTK